jgi:hypothetical protein
MKNIKTRFTIALAAVVLVGSLQSALTTVPGIITFRGSLTDALGVSVNTAEGEPKFINVAIYRQAENGVSLWQETHPVDVNGGQFVVEFGSDVVNPLPPNLFNAPLFIGITVGDDTTVATNEEMTPRQPLTSVALSFKAGDADTLGGRTGAALDQSAHVWRIQRIRAV